MISYNIGILLFTLAITQAITQYCPQKIVILRVDYPCFVLYFMFGDSGFSCRTYICLDIKIKIP